MCVAEASMKNIDSLTTAPANFTEQPVAFSVSNRQLNGRKMTKDDGRANNLNHW